MRRRFSARSRKTSCLRVFLRRIPSPHGVHVGKLEDDQPSLRRPISFRRFGKRGRDEVAPAVLLDGLPRRVRGNARSFPRRVPRLRRGRMRPSNARSRRSPAAEVAAAPNRRRHPSRRRHRCNRRNRQRRAAAAVPAAAVAAAVLSGREPVGIAVAVAAFETLCAVINSVHAGEHRVEQQHRSQAPRTGHQSRFPPRLRVPARRHGTAGDAAAGVVVRGALATALATPRSRGPRS